MMRRFRSLAALATMVAVAGPAMAVGDPPRTLDRRQAAAAYARVRSLLTNDAITCPRGQVPMAGRVTGGSAPGTGSQTTTIDFDKGASVTIVREWHHAGSGSATTTITCS